MMTMTTAESLTPAERPSLRSTVNDALKRVQQQAKTHSWNSLVFLGLDNNWMIEGADAVEVAFCCPQLAAYRRRDGRYSNPVVSYPTNKWRA